jgi:hypothetical protein
MRSTVKKTLRGRRTGRYRPDRSEPAPAKAGVKSNQPTLLRTITEITAAVEPLSVCHSRDTARGRDESRAVGVFDPQGKLDGTDWQAHVRASIRVERVVCIRNAGTGFVNAG